MLGDVKDDEIAALPDLNLREAMTLIPLVVMAIVMGIYPKPFLEMIEQPVNAIVARVDPSYFEGTGITPPPLPTTTASVAVAPEDGVASLEELLRQQQAQAVAPEATEIDIDADTEDTEGSEN